MISCSYKSLKKKAMELKRAVDSKTRPHPRTEGLIESSDQRKGPRTKTLGDLVSRMKTTHQLTSLSHIFTNLKDYRPSIDHILDPPTSGYSSDCYEDDDKCNRISSLSYTEVKNLLMDTSVLKTLPDNGQVKEGSNVLMLISDIKLDLNFFRLRAFLNKLRTRPVLLKAKFFFYQDNYSLMLQFEKAEQARVFYFSCVKKISNFETLFGKRYSVSWVKVDLNKRDGSRRKKYNHRDPGCFFRNDFYGAILRNLPPDTKPDDIINFLAGKKIRSRIDQICCLKHEYFTLAIFNNLEDAEKTCFYLNDKKINDRKLKAHLHPKCCKKRKPEADGIFRGLFQVENQKREVQKMRSLLERINMEPLRRDSSNNSYREDSRKSSHRHRDRSRDSRSDRERRGGDKRGRRLRGSGFDSSQKSDTRHHDPPKYENGHGGVTGFNGVHHNKEIFQPDKSLRREQKDHQPSRGNEYGYPPQPKQQQKVNQPWRQDYQQPRRLHDPPAYPNKSILSNQGSRDQRFDSRGPYRGGAGGPANHSLPYHFHAGNQPSLFHSQSAGDKPPSLAMATPHSMPHSLSSSNIIDNQRYKHSQPPQPPKIKQFSHIKNFTQVPDKYPKQGIMPPKGSKPEVLSTQVDSVVKHRPTPPPPPPKQPQVEVPVNVPLPESPPPPPPAINKEEEKRMIQGVDRRKALNEKFSKMIKNPSEIRRKSLKSRSKSVRRDRKRRSRSRSRSKSRLKDKKERKKSSANYKYDKKYTDERTFSPKRISSSKNYDSKRDRDKGRESRHAGKKSSHYKRERSRHEGYSERERERDRGRGRERERDRDDRRYEDRRRRDERRYDDYSSSKARRREGDSYERKGNQKLRELDEKIKSRKNRYSKRSTDKRGD